MGVARNELMTPSVKRVGLYQSSNCAARADRRDRGPPHGLLNGWDNIASTDRQQIDDVKATGSRATTTLVVIPLLIVFKKARPTVAVRTTLSSWNEIEVTLSGGGLLSAENDVGGVCGRLVFGDVEAERRQVNPGEHCFALPEHDGGQGQTELVEQSRAKVLTHRLDAPADLHVATIGGLLRLIQRRLDTLGHKDKGGAAFHLDRIARMMRQHEGRRVIGRIGAPPTLPALVRPGAADRPEHIAAEDEGAEAVHRTMCVGLIDAVRAAALTGHCPEGARA